MDYSQETLIENLFESLELELKIKSVESRENILKELILDMASSVKKDLEICYPSVTFHFDWCTLLTGYDNGDGHLSVHGYDANKSTPQPLEYDEDQTNEDHMREIPIERWICRLRYVNHKKCDCDHYHTFTRFYIYDLLKLIEMFLFYKKHPDYINQFVQNWCPNFHDV